MEQSEGPASPAGWFKATASTASCTCVEVRFLADAVQVRDSKQISAVTGENVSRVITLPAEDWRQFLRKIDEDELGPAAGPLQSTADHDGTVVLHCLSSGIELTYDIEEWHAFRAGVRDGEFDLPSAERSQEKSPLEMPGK